MRRVLIVSLSVVLLALCGSGCSKFGKGGGASPGDVGYGDGNIPLAEAGDELADVNFAFDSSSLNSVAQGKLRENSRWLLDNPQVNVVIEGHCDERGTEEYNLALGERRASSARDFLRSLGIASERMSTVSYGEALPLDPRSSEDAWAKNRRAHFKVGG